MRNVDTILEVPRPESPRSVERGAARGNRILALDALRGVAAFAVVLYHYTYRFGEVFTFTRPPIVQFGYGDHGVALFFMISGFVIFMTLERTERPLGFVVSRASRLYPTYWAAVVVTFFVVSAWPLPGRELSVLAFVANLTMLQEWMPGIEHVDGVYWTLAVELTFYVVMFIFYRLDLLMKIEWLALGWIGLALAVRGTFLEDSFGAGTLSRILILRYCNLFIAGIMFYRIYSATRIRLPSLIIALCLLAQPVVDAETNSGLVATFFLIFALFVGGKIDWLGMRPLVFLGTISYALYLVHQNVGYVIIRWFQAQGLPEDVGICSAVAMSVLIATGITFLVERPAIAAIRTRYNAHRAKSAT